MRSFTTISLLTTVALASAASVSLERRATVKTDFMLHAYGASAAGIIGSTQLMYADGNGVLKCNSADKEDFTGIPVSLRSIAPSSDDLD